MSAVVDETSAVCDDLISLFNLENLWVMSSGDCRSATCTFLISKFSVGVLTSVASQLEDSGESHRAPLHHSVDVKSAVGAISLDSRSAGLD